jgi:hypothetical protein
MVLLLAACSGRTSAPDRPVDEDARTPADQGPRVLDLEALAAVEVGGWERAAQDRSPTSLVVSLRSGDLRGLVTIGPCVTCRPAEVPELRQLMPGGLEDDPSTRFELRATEIAGWRCTATWELGAVRYTDEVVASHAARLYCGDDAIEVVVRVDDDTVAAAHSPEAARAAAHREIVENGAKAIAEAYLGRM